MTKIIFEHFDELYQCQFTIAELDDGSYDFAISSINVEFDPGTNSIETGCMIARNVLRDLATQLDRLATKHKQ